MAQKVIYQLVDDLDGTELGDSGGETVTFGLDNVNYEIDLSAANAAALRETLAAYVAAARPQPRARRGGSSTVGAKPARRDLAAIRAWAREQGTPMPDRGRIPVAILAAYEAAHA
ncbi:hypothetical protein ATY41_08170 [Leifsonia xyli subsp. xyli]|uniref:Lsr2 family protein n=2 Tax=Leifsonia xyli subsp. xyli TaxID=59736 RepID=Q6AEG6_LEIXX|nr:Lsr2 family protein [Leifsonia xyli]AAT89230.1 conserved hypothetical protein [Leifsonia xyli subsp. xyli str. CTCB07]ODA90880.1 hypothetical protein ATY41_08170 [Leifsonia xyli subsp. xyli]